MDVSIALIPDILFCPVCEKHICHGLFLGTLGAWEHENGSYTVNLSPAARSSGETIESVPSGSVFACRSFLCGWNEGRCWADSWHLFLLLAHDNNMNSKGKFVFIVFPFLNSQEVGNVYYLFS